MTRILAISLATALTCVAGPAGLGPRTAAAAITPQQPGNDDAQIRQLLQRVEEAAQQASVPAYLELLSGTADRDLAGDFARLEFVPGATRVVIQERDRQDLLGTLPGNGYSLMVDAFMEYGDRGRVTTWLLEVKRVDDAWLLAGQQRVSAVENLYRLSVNPAKQYDAHNFIVIAEDLQLTLVDGSVFVVETDQGVTGLVLLGHGELKFSPAPETEKGQVRIFAGADMVQTSFDAAFVRVGTFEAHADPSVLKPRAVNPRDLKRAQQVFREEGAKSFAVDLADLTRDNWSLLPGVDDFLAEVRTRRFETLTYARSASEPEDVSFFERRRHRNISVYASKAKLASRGPTYNEDDLEPFDVIDHKIDVTYQPDRQWIDGHAVMKIRTRTPNLGQLTIRLADNLVVRSLTSDVMGRLFTLRVVNQNAVLVSLPAPVAGGTEMTLTVEYSGRLEPQLPETETLAQGQVQNMSTMSDDDPFLPHAEPSYLYSNRSYWYPQSTVTDYATATIHLTVPAEYGCVASGEESFDSPRALPVRGSSAPMKIYTFTAVRPVRYLAFVVSRLVRADRWTVAFEGERAADVVKSGAPPVADPAYKRLDLIVDANPLQTGRGKEVAEHAVDVVQYYESVIGDSPYSAFTVALVENALPGGHSPGYFAVLNQPLANSGVTWRNDPAAFANYPDFFLAHEIAHQWWGQAVGWRNYHEQWLSEGFAQYFAALYAQKSHGDELFGSVMRQMRKWAIDESDQGPVYLGYRVGHIKNQGRAFRAVVYNKGAIVLHMLRRLVGDEVFFRGIRRFYLTSRFTKVGTDDFRQAMEAESGRSLTRFFDRWIYNSSLPRLTLSYRVDGAPGTPGAPAGSVALHFEQAGDIFDVPVTVMLQYTDHKPVDVVVPVTDRIVDFRAPLEGTLRSVEVSRDDGTLAEVTIVR